MLDQIVENTRRRLPDVLARASQIRVDAESAGPVRDLEASLAAPGLSVISEFKRASPSRGTLNNHMDPESQALLYSEGGAAALSVLTEPDFFGGTVVDLTLARSVVEIPVLRKDFTLDPVHVWEARAIGADAILLIVAILDAPSLANLLNVAHDAGLAAVVEVHDREEAWRAVDHGARIVGVNNRNLHTFEVDLSTAEQIAPLVEGVSVTIAESGVRSPGDAARMHEAGYDAVLVGEYLVQADDPRRSIEELRGR